jgi:hypothetical protein
MANTSWNPSDRTNVTLSGGNLTANATAAPSVDGFTSLKCYFEYTRTTWAGLIMTLGVLIIQHPQIQNAAIYAGNGFIYVNSSQQFLRIVFASQRRCHLHRA